jgi:hypothetical protein
MLEARTAARLEQQSQQRERPRRKDESEHDYAAARCKCRIQSTRILSPKCSTGDLEE